MEFSRLILGTVQFGLNYGIANTAGKPDYETARDIVRMAYENGINILDTAAAYGDSEAVVGRALSELRLRERMQVISKVPPVSARGLSHGDAERFIVASVERSLERLGLEQLAAVLFHREEDIKYIDVLRHLEQRGLTAGCGVSLDTAACCGDILREEVRFVQLPYNILDKRFDEFFLKADGLGVNIFARSVYLQGLLLLPENEIRAFLREVIPIRHRLEKLARQSEMTPAELYMRFVLSNPAVTSVLTGVDNTGQLEQNLALFSRGPLSPELHAEAKAAVPQLEERLIRPALWQ